jgi:heterodisulfide reductase subunit A
VAFIKCVGSRDDSKGKSYCSQSLLYVYSQARLSGKRQNTLQSEAYVFYMDVSAPPARGYEEFYHAFAGTPALNTFSGRVSKIYPVKEINWF